MKFTDIELLKGKIVTQIEGEVGDYEMKFHLQDGEYVNFYHVQDCCETVYIADIVGDLSDLLGSPLLIAEEATNSEENPEGFDDEYQESFTWTYYKFATRKGYVDIRWLGSSNGYYSESVNYELRS